MDNKLSKLKTFKKINLTDEERNLLRVHAARIVIASPVLVTESFFKRGVQHGLRIALSSMLFIVFIAGSVSAVANNALPGDPLYSFKINVNEEVKGLLLPNTPQAKIADAQYRLQTRIQEIQTLADSNSLTPAKQATAAAAINTNIAALSANLTTLSSQSPNSALSVTASLEQTLKANKTTLENTPTTGTSQDDGKAAALQTVSDTLAKVSNQEVQIISKEIDNINTGVNAVPDSASGALQDTSVSAGATATQTPSTSPLKVTPLAP